VHDAHGKRFTMIIDVIVEIVGMLLGEAIVDSTDRGVVLSVSAASLASCAVTVWLLTTSRDLFSRADWSIGVIVWTVLSGVAGTLFSLLHVQRSSDRLLGSVCLTINVAAIVIPLLLS
jgi:peptidoglycan biosynthesis protein MviN/MurJ (putative lipid II flippase)